MEVEIKDTGQQSWVERYFLMAVYGFKVCIALPLLSLMLGVALPFWCIGAICSGVIRLCKR